MRHSPPVRPSRFPYTTLFRSMKVSADPLNYVVARTHRGKQGTHEGIAHGQASAPASKFGRTPRRGGRGGLPMRSEEHTSELQSHHELVCRLLLEKKKNNTSMQ